MPETGRARVAWASAAVVAGGLTVALTELFREAAVAASFGSGAAVDAFFGIWIVPSVLIGSALYLGRLALVPLATFTLEEDSERAAADLGNTFGWVTLGAVALAAVLALAAGPLARLVLPGLDAEVAPVAAASLAALGPYLVGGVLAAYAAAVLHARRRFLGVALATAIPNLAVAATALLAPEDGVLALGWAFSAGSVVQALVLWGLLRAAGVSLVPQGRWPGAFMRRLAAVAWAPALLIAIRNLAPVVDRSCASLLEPGSVASLNYAYRIAVGVRVLVTGTAFTVSVPFLAALYARGDETAAERLVERSIRAVVFVLAPVAVLLVPLGPSLVGVVLMRGAFGPAAAELTGQTLAVLAQTLLPDALFAIAAAPYFARGMPRVPLRVVGVIWPFHLVLVWPMARAFGVTGIAATGVGVAVASAFAMARRARRDRGGGGLSPPSGHRTQGRRLLTDAGRRDVRAAALAAGAALATTFALRGLLPPLTEPLAPRVLATGGIVALAGVVYATVVLAASRRTPASLVDLLRGR